jgi:hypothetical protein
MYQGKNNYGVGQKVDNYDDFSFLKSDNFDEFIKKAKNTETPPPQLAIIKHEKEQEIDKSLTKLNNEIYNEEKGLGEETRMYLVFAAILTIIDNKDNISISEENSKIFNNEKLIDGEVILNKIQEFLNDRKLPKIKKDFVLKTLTVILLDENINRIENGESQLKRVFIKIIDQIGLYYKIGNALQAKVVFDGATVIDDQIPKRYEQLAFFFFHQLRASQPLQYCGQHHILCASLSLLGRI